LVAAPTAFIVLLLAKMVSKTIGVYPTTKAFGYVRQEGIYTTLLMSTGLTFGTISALFGLSHQLITQEQYSHLVAAVIASAVVPTVIANAFFLPRYLIPKRQESVGQTPVSEPEAAVQAVAGGLSGDLNSH
jgi:Kef-type K+ transport system membrane component KefB